MNIEPVGKVIKQSPQESVLEIIPMYKDGLSGIAPGDRLQVLYWMHELKETERQRLKVHPRGDKNRPLTGVFALRSPMRPNPIGVSDVRVTRIVENRVVVTGLDALDGSPILDLKRSRA